MRSGRETPAILKVGLGVGIGYALYRLFGLAGGFGPGPGGGGGLGPGGRHEDGSGTGAPDARPPSRPSDMHDVQVLVRPSPIDPTKGVLEMEGQIVPIGELVARIDASGQRNVTVIVTDDTQQEAWDEIQDVLNFLGIQLGPRSQLPPRRCKIRVASNGITIDGRLVTVKEAVTACKAAKDVEVFVTGGARQSDYEDLEAAFQQAGIRWVKVTKSMTVSP